MGKPRKVDEHEELVNQAIVWANHKGRIPLLATIEKSTQLISSSSPAYINATPGGEIDSYGIDHLLQLTTGLAVPLQVKAGKETVGIVLPLDNNLKNVPERLRGRVSLRMVRKARSHWKKHQGVKALLFVAKPKNTSPSAFLETYEQIVKEITEIISVMIRHTCHNYKLFQKTLQQASPH